MVHPDVIALRCDQCGHEWQIAGRRENVWIF
jgi:hypothetical protein